MDETSSNGSSPPSAAPREPPRPATRPPAPPSAPSFENHAFQPDETDCAPRHDEALAQNGDTQNGDPKRLSQNGAEPNRLSQNGTKMGDPNHDGNQLNNESFGVNNGKVDTPVDVKEKSAYEAVNLELVNIAPKNGGMNKDNMLPAKKDVRVDISTNSYDEYFVPVNQHRKFMRGEKLYVTADKRKRGGCQRPLTWTLGLVLLVAAILIITLAATGVIFKSPATPVNGTETNEETTPMSPFNLPSHANRTLTNDTETRHSMHNIDAAIDTIMPTSDDGYLENSGGLNTEASPEPSNEPRSELSKTISESSAEPTKAEPIPEPTSEPSPEPSPAPAASESSPEPTSEPEPATHIQSSEPASEPAPEPIGPEYVPVAVSEPVPEPTTTATPEETKSEPVAKEEVMPEAGSEPTSEPSPNQTSSEAQPEPSPELGPSEIIPGSSAEPTSEPVARETTPGGSSEPSPEPAANDTQNMEDNYLAVVEFLNSANPAMTTDEPKSSSMTNEEPSAMPTTSQPDQTDVVREDKQLDHSIHVVGSVETTTRGSEMSTEMRPTSESSATEGQVPIVISSSPEGSGDADHGSIAMTRMTSPSPAMETTSMEPSVSAILVEGSQTINMDDDIDVENDTNSPTEEEPTITITQESTQRPQTERTHLLFPNSPASSETEPPQEPELVTSTSESSINMAPETAEPTSEEHTDPSNPVSDTSETTMENKLDTMTNSEASNDISNTTDREMATHGPIMLTDILHPYEVTEPSQETSTPKGDETATTASEMDVVTEISSPETSVTEDNADTVTGMPPSSSEVETGRGFMANYDPQIIIETSTSSEPIVVPPLPSIQQETTEADTALTTQNTVTMKIDNVAGPAVENAEVPKIEMEATTVMEMPTTTESVNVAVMTTKLVNEIVTMTPGALNLETKENDVPELKTYSPPTTSTSTKFTSEPVSDTTSPGIMISEVSHTGEAEMSSSANAVTTTEKVVAQQVMETTIQPIFVPSTDEAVSATDNEVSPSNMGSTPAPAMEEKIVPITTTASTRPEATTQSVEEEIKQFNDVISAEITKSNEVAQPMEKTISEATTVPPVINMLTQSAATVMTSDDVNTEMPAAPAEEVDMKFKPVETTTGMNEVVSASSTVENTEVPKAETTTQSVNTEEVTTPKSEPPMAITETNVQNETSTTISNDMLNRELGDPIFDIIAHLTTASQPSTTSETPQEITPSSTEVRTEEPTTETMQQAEKDVKETLKENLPTATSMQSTQQTEMTSEMPLELASSTEMRNLATSTEEASQGTPRDVTAPPTERTTVTSGETKSSHEADATTTTEAVKETSSEQMTANEMDTEMLLKTLSTETDNTEVTDSTALSGVTTEGKMISEDILSITTAKAMDSSSIDSLQTEPSTESQTSTFDVGRDLVANTPEVTFRVANFSCQSAISDPLPLISKLEGLLTKAIISDVPEDNEENKVVRVTDLRPGGIVTYSIQWTPKAGTRNVFNTIPQDDLTELNDYLHTNNRLLGDFLVPDDATETTKYDFSTCQDDNLSVNDIFEDSLNLYPGTKEEASPLKI